VSNYQNYYFIDSSEALVLDLKWSYPECPNDRLLRAFTNPTVAVLNCKLFDSKMQFLRTLPRCSTAANSLESNSVYYMKYYWHPSTAQRAVQDTIKIETKKDSVRCNVKGGTTIYSASTDAIDLDVTLVGKRRSDLAY
jgi:hypothetical protein